MVEADIDRSASMGTIQLKVFRVIEHGLTRDAPHGQRQENLEIAEKALKGRSISHATGFGRPIP